MKVFLIAVGAALVAIAAVSLVIASRAPQFDYGRYRDQVFKSQAVLDREPCDRGAVVRLVNAKMRAGDNRGAITSARAFLDGCGDLLPLREALFAAHRRLSERDVAIAEASHLLKAQPWNPTYLWWRGQVYGEKGDWTRALEDQRRSAALCPDCMGQFDFADALEKVGRPCEAIEPLATVLTLRRNVRRSAVEGRLAELRARSECREWNGTGTARFPYERAAAFAPLSVNGVPLGRAIVDTGATYVAISRQDAQRARLTGPALDARFNTAGGVRTGRITGAASVEAGGVRAQHVTVVIMDGLPMPLLGMSFLSRFDILLDRDGVELRER